MLPRPWVWSPVETLRAHPKFPVAQGRRCSERVPQHAAERSAHFRKEEIGKKRLSTGVGWSRSLNNSDPSVQGEAGELVPK